MTRSMMPNAGDRWRSDRWQELCRLKKWQLITMYRNMLGQPAYPTAGGPRTVEEIASAIVGMEWTDKIRAEHFAKAREGHERCGVMNFEIIHERVVTPDNADSVAPKLSPQEAAQIQEMLDARRNAGKHGPECGETDGVMADWVTPMAVCSRSPGHWEAIHREIRNGGYVWAEWREVLPGSAWEAARAKRFPSRFGKQARA